VVSLSKKPAKVSRADAADVLNDAQGAVGALGEFAREEIRSGLEIGERHLPLADLVGVGGRDAAAGGAAGFLGEDVRGSLPTRGRGGGA